MANSQQPKEKTNNLPLLTLVSEEIRVSFPDAAFCGAGCRLFKQSDLVSLVSSLCPL
jgi:hypothetical protein